MAELQGKEVNIESGEEPGKCIHEYRPSNHQHLTVQLDKPWYLYPDKIMRNYDSVDATPLFLTTIYRYLQVTPQTNFAKIMESHVRSALNWILYFADSNQDGFIDYALNPKRQFGGLQNQNWMDSSEATFHESGELVVYPLAPVEAQAYTYQALRLWQKYFSVKDKDFAKKLDVFATNLKKNFNQKFVIRQGDGSLFLASALASDGLVLKSVRSSMGHCLWASLTPEEDQVQDSILERQYVARIVERLFAEDLYEKKIGVRTLSKNSVGYLPNSYHNGSIWPHDNSIIADGLDKFGYHQEAAEIRQSILAAIAFFKTPIELFVYDKTYQPYVSAAGQNACQYQAWSAAAVLRSLDYTELATKMGLFNFLSNWLKKYSYLPQFELVGSLPLIKKLLVFEKRR